MNLGVTFDQNMTFSLHVDDVVQRCTGLLVGLSHCRHSLPQSVMASLVQALVVSIIRYCISIYGSCNDTQTSRLQKLLNFGARVVSGRRKYDHVRDVLRDLGWLSARNLHVYHCLSLLNRMLTTGQPETLYRELRTAGDVHGRVTRQALQLRPPAIHSESGRRRFLYAAVTSYNNLPQAIRDASPLHFRSELRQYLLQQQQ